MLSLPSDTASFEFSQGEGDAAQVIKTTGVDYFKGLLKALPATVKTGETDFSGELKIPDTTEAITKAALEYQFNEAKAGRNISAAEAVTYVLQGAK